MRYTRVVLSIVLLSALAPSLRADLFGASVTGSLTFGAGNPINYFLAANGFVPDGYANATANPVVIGAGEEFGFYDVINLDTADFTGTQLTIGDLSRDSTAPFQMTFTSSAFAGLTLEELSDTFPAGVTGSRIGDVIRINFDGATAGIQRSSRLFTNTSARSRANLSCATGHDVCVSWCAIKKTPASSRSLSLGRDPDRSWTGRASPFSPSEHGP